LALPDWQNRRGKPDEGPAERYQHGDIIRSEPTERAGITCRRVMTQSMLDRYAARNQITQRQFDAGQRLYRMWRAAGGEQRVTAFYTVRVQGQPDISDREAELRHRVTQLLRDMGALSGILVHVCLCDAAARDWATARGDAAQAGLAILRLALDGLADHWRL
jgi:hypothetical protein